MEKLCKYVYAHDGTDRLRTRAILSHVYHHALHDNWFQARDLILMSHLQETIQHSDPATQVCILYNEIMLFHILMNFFPSISNYRFYTTELLLIWVYVHSVTRILKTHTIV